MDRRQRKTRVAIFNAFIELLNSKNVSSITVQDIIDKADIGRATFYAHFETKDYLLKALCEELFSHIVETPKETHYFNCKSDESVFLHLIKHIYENDDNILLLLSCKNNEVFLKYFKDNLKTLVLNQLEKSKVKNKDLPKDYLVNHISSTFVETINWWAEGKMNITPEDIAKYFYQSLSGLVEFV